MRFLLAILLLIPFDTFGYQSNVVNAFMNFSAGTKDAKLTPTILSNSAIGHLDWDYVGTSTNFRSMTIGTNVPVELLTPQAITGTNQTNTGTKFVYWDHYSAFDAEYIEFTTPGSAYTFSNIIIRAIMRFGAINTNAGVNYDFLSLYGGSFCVCQQQTAGSGGVMTLNGLVVHSQTNGVSYNGPYIHPDTNKFYEVHLIRDYIRSNCILRLYDPVTGDLFGESITSTFNSAGEFGVLTLRVGANYSGHTYGQTWIGGISATYSNQTPAIQLDKPIESLLRSNRFEWIPGTNVGVIGGIPTRTGTTRDVTQAPYNADNTGSADAGAAINAALNASASNDIVYLPAGVYNVGTTSISHNVSGVLLKGAGTNTIVMGGIVLGHSSSGAEAFAVTNGGAMGTTNLVLPDMTDAFGNTIAAGDAFEITQLEDTTNPAFPVISVFNDRRQLAQVVYVHSVSGSTVSLTAPLIWDFTNSPQVKSLSLTGNSGLRFKQGIGVEDMLITTTNAGQSSSIQTLIAATSLRDSWIRGVAMEYPNNYGFTFASCVNIQVESNRIGRATGGGNSRSGGSMSTVSGALIINNIFHDLSVGFQAQGGSFAGNAVFGNYFTNISDKDLLIHNTHPFHNAWEQNKLGVFVPDGYFGSQSHDDVFRNSMASTFGPKRFVSHFNIAGNVIGSSALSWVYEETNSGYTTPYPAFTFGYPHIGNVGYTGESPDIGFNWPGTIEALSGGLTYPNTGFVFTANVPAFPTNVLWTNFGAGGTFTNFIGYADGGYPIVFQDSVNTNLYWPTNGGLSSQRIYAATNGSSSNVFLRDISGNPTFVTVSNGWRMLMAGSGAYNQHQTDTRATHFLAENVVYTNAPGTVVINDRTPDQTIPITLVYARTGKPAWWLTNAWPAIGPDVSGYATPIPAEDRWMLFNAAGSGESVNNTPAGIPLNIRIRP